MERPRIVLASTSRYRRALLERLAIPFESIAPDCDEDAHPHLTPRALAEHLAREKAESIAVPGAVVIGSDQVVDLDGEVLGKPGSAEAAERQLARLAGRSHRLITAVAVRDVDRGITVADVDVHTLHMRALDRGQIAAYVAHDAPLDCAGSYVHERRGIALFDRVEADPDTADDTAIIGLPLMKLLRLLRGVGIDPLTW